MKPAIIIGAIITALAVFIIVTLQMKLTNEREAHATTKVAYANYRGEAEKAAREAADKDRATEAKWRADYKTLDNQWSEKYATLNTKYGKLDDASRRMSGQLATFTTASKNLAATAITAAEREAVATAFDLLSDMHRELGEREVILAKALDRSHGEGLACQAFYEVTEPSASP